MQELKLLLHFYKSIFLILLLLCAIVVFVQALPIPFFIAFIPIGIDYLFRYTFRKNTFYFYLNKGFSIHKLYLYSLLINILIVSISKLFLNGTGSY